jgi:predicted SAM-dependent methyltransferase
MVNIEVIKKINIEKNAILELGCGNKKKNPTYIGIDILNSPEVDLKGDVFEILSQIDSGVINEIHSSHFIEHIDDLELLLRECSRILKPGGKFIARVPHHSNPYFYSDYTHKRFFGLYTMQYFCKTKYFYRIVPNYDIDFDFTILKIKILFGAEKPFYLKYILGKAFNVIFNLSTLIKEFYETNLTKLFPCTELDIELKKGNK